MQGERAMPLTIVIIGATGDLTARKLVPALYALFSKGRLTDDTARGLVRDLMAALKAWAIKLRN